MVVSLSLVGSNGDEIALDGSGDFVIQPGLRGLGLTPAELRITQSAGDGGVWRSTRRTVRTLDVPLAVLGSDRLDVESKLRRFAAAISDRYGTPKLRATYDDGRKFDLVVHYSGGGETTYGDEAGNLFCLWPVTFTAPSPFWVSTDSVQLTVAPGASTSTMLPNLLNLSVSPTSASGVLTVENPGDVEAFPVWTITGPTSDVTITLDGVGFVYEAGTVAGDSITIDTASATVRDHLGVNKYAGLSAAPKFFAIPPGTSTITILATGVDSSTRVSGYFNPRREVIF